MVVVRPGKRGVGRRERRDGGKHGRRFGPRAGGDDDGRLGLLQQPLHGLAVGLVPELHGQLKDPRGAEGRHPDPAAPTVDLGVAVLVGAPLGCQRLLPPLPCRRRHLQQLLLPLLLLSPSPILLLVVVDLDLQVVVLLVLALPYSIGGGGFGFAGGGAPWIRDLEELSPQRLDWGNMEEEDGAYAMLVEHEGGEGDMARVFHCGEGRAAAALEALQGGEDNAASAFHCGEGRAAAALEALQGGEGDAASAGRRGEIGRYSVVVVRTLRLRISLRFLHFWDYELAIFWCCRQQPAALIRTYSI